MKRPSDTVVNKMVCRQNDLSKPLSVKMDSVPENSSSSSSGIGGKGDGISPTPLDLDGGILPTGNDATSGRRNGNRGVCDGTTTPDNSDMIRVADKTAVPPPPKYPPSARPPEKGTSVKSVPPKDGFTIGDYRFLRTLGQGTFGKVKLGEHVRTKQKVAIKIMNKEKMKKYGTFGNVRQELQNLSKMDPHPHLIQLIEVLDFANELFIVMEYASGGDLFDFIIKKVRLNEAEARVYFQQLIGAIAEFWTKHTKRHCHMNMVVHRDLKPENILVEEQLIYQDNGYSGSDGTQGGISHQGQCNAEIQNGSASSSCSPGDQTSANVRRPGDPGSAAHATGVPSLSNVVVDNMEKFKKTVFESTPDPVKMAEGMMGAIARTPGAMVEGMMGAMEEVGTKVAEGTRMIGETGQRFIREPITTTKETLIGAKDTLMAAGTNAKDTAISTAKDTATTALNTAKGTAGVAKDTVVYGMSATKTAMQHGFVGAVDYNPMIPRVVKERMKERVIGGSPTGDQDGSSLSLHKQEGQQNLVANPAEPTPGAPTPGQQDSGGIRAPPVTPCTPFLPAIGSSAAVASAVTADVPPAVVSSPEADNAVPAPAPGLTAPNLNANFLWARCPQRKRRGSSVCNNTGATIPPNGGVPAVTGGTPSTTEFCAAGTPDTEFVQPSPLCVERRSEGGSSSSMSAPGPPVLCGPAGELQTTRGSVTPGFDSKVGSPRRVEQKGLGVISPKASPTAPRGSADGRNKKIASGRRRSGSSTGLTRRGPAENAVKPGSDCHTLLSSTALDDSSPALAVDPKSVASISSRSSRSSGTLFQNPSPRKKIEVVDDAADAGGTAGHGGALEAEQRQHTRSHDSLVVRPREEESIPSGSEETTLLQGSDGSPERGSAGTLTVGALTRVEKPRAGEPEGVNAGGGDALPEGGIQGLDNVKNAGPAASDAGDGVHEKTFVDETATSMGDVVKGVVSDAAAGTDVRAKDPMSSTKGTTEVSPQINIEAGTAGVRAENQVTKEDFPEDCHPNSQQHADTDSSNADQHQSGVCPERTDVLAGDGEDTYSSAITSTKRAGGSSLATDICSRKNTVVPARENVEGVKNGNDNLNEADESAEAQSDGISSRGKSSRRGAATIIPDLPCSLSAAGCAPVAADRHIAPPAHGVDGVQQSQAATRIAVSSGAEALGTVSEENLTMSSLMSSTEEKDGRSDYSIDNKHEADAAEPAGKLSISSGQKSTPVVLAGTKRAAQMVHTPRRIWARHSVKVADFGLSNRLKQGEFLKTSCGSPNYASPEVVTGKDYAGPEIDVWSCGVVLFALLHSQLPFDDPCLGTLFRKIKHGNFTLSSHLSREARDLIVQMLLVDPAKRISIVQIRTHPWFRTDLPRYLQPSVSHLYMSACARSSFPRGRGSTTGVKGGREELGVEASSFTGGLDNDASLSEGLSHDGGGAGASSLDEMCAPRGLRKAVADFDKRCVIGGDSHEKVAAVQNKFFGRADYPTVIPGIDANAEEKDVDWGPSRWRLGLEFYNVLDPRTLLHSVFTTLREHGFEWRTSPGSWRIEARLAAGEGAESEEGDEKGELGTTDGMSKEHGRLKEEVQEEHGQTNSDRSLLQTEAELENGTPDGEEDAPPSAAGNGTSSQSNAACPDAVMNVDSEDEGLVSKKGVAEVLSGDRQAPPGGAANDNSIPPKGGENVVVKEDESSACTREEDTTNARSPTTCTKETAVPVCDIHTCSSEVSDGQRSHGNNGIDGTTPSTGVHADSKELEDRVTVKSSTTEQPGDSHLLRSARKTSGDAGDDDIENVAQAAAKTYTSRCGGVHDVKKNVDRSLSKIAAQSSSVPESAPIVPQTSKKQDLPTTQEACNGNTKASLHHESSQDAVGSSCVNKGFVHAACFSSLSPDSSEVPPEKRSAPDKAGTWQDFSLILQLFRFGVQKYLLDFMLKGSFLTGGIFAAAELVTKISDQIIDMQSDASGYICSKSDHSSRRSTRCVSEAVVPAFRMLVPRVIEEEPHCSSGAVATSARHHASLGGPGVSTNAVVQGGGHVSSKKRNGGGIAMPQLSSKSGFVLPPTNHQRAKGDGKPAMPTQTGPPFGVQAGKKKIGKPGGGYHHDIFARSGGTKTSCALEDPPRPPVHRDRRKGEGPSDAQDHRQKGMNNGGKPTEMSLTSGFHQHHPQKGGFLHHKGKKKGFDPPKKGSLSKPHSTTDAMAQMDPATRADTTATTHMAPQSQHHHHLREEELSQQKGFHKTAAAGGGHSVNNAPSHHHFPPGGVASRSKKRGGQARVPRVSGAHVRERPLHSRHGFFAGKNQNHPSDLQQQRFTGGKRGPPDWEQQQHHDLIVGQCHQVGAAKGGGRDTQSKGGNPWRGG